jgi:hypothetical protein
MQVFTEMFHRGLYAVLPASDILSEEYLVVLIL